MEQLITPNPYIFCYPGWCLMYVRQAFGLPARYGSATEAWEKSASQHRDRDFPPGVAVPVWYGLANVPEGHVVLRMPDGSVFSTSDLDNTPHHHPNLEDLEWYYAHYDMPLTYRGWTEDVASYPVIAPAGVNVSGTITATSASEEDDMPSLEQTFYYPVPKYDVHGQEIGTTSLAEVLAHNEANFTRQRQLTIDSIKEIVTGVLTTEVFNVATGGTTTLGSEVSWNAWNAKQLREAVGAHEHDGDVPQIDPEAIAEKIAQAIGAKLTAEPVVGIPSAVPGPAKG